MTYLDELIEEADRMLANIHKHMQEGNTNAAANTMLSLGDAIRQCGDEPELLLEEC